MSSGEKLSGIRWYHSSRTDRVTDSTTVPPRVCLHKSKEAGWNRERERASEGWGEKKIGRCIMAGITGTWSLLCNARHCSKTKDGESLEANSTLSHTRKTERGSCGITMHARLRGAKIKPSPFTWLGQQRRECCGDVHECDAPFTLRHRQCKQAELSSILHVLHTLSLLLPCVIRRLCTDAWSRILHLQCTRITPYLYAQSIYRVSVLF